MIKKENAFIREILKSHSMKFLDESSTCKITSLVPASIAVFVYFLCKPTFHTPLAVVTINTVLPSKIVLRLHAEKMYGQK